MQKQSLIKNWRCYRTGIVSRKIIPSNFCEINAVDHCNITCMDCNHASPAVKMRIANPDFVFRDLSTLSRYYRSPMIKILGGEPLLHPNILALVKEIRHSGISRKIRLVTNGILLPQMKDEVWKEIDEIEISVYPQTQHLLTSHMADIYQSARLHQVTIIRYFYANFRAAFSTIGTTDHALTQRIYNTCRFARLWGCQSIYEGYFFKCPHSIYIPDILDRAVSYDRREDGVRIIGTSAFSGKLKKFLSSRNPLRACRYCLGSVGMLRPHKLINTACLKSVYAVPIEEMVDYEKLLRLENGSGAFDSDKIQIQ
ncbi:MAG: 4Fe-4S cluster-binding domain-containing protein [Smithella sp.]